MNKVRSFLLCLSIFWLLGFMYMFMSSNSSENSVESKSSAIKDEYDQGSLLLDENVKINLKKILADLRVLEVKNAKNEEIIRELREVANRVVVDRNHEAELPSISIADAPSQHFEDTRRKLFLDIQDLSFFFNNRFKEKSSSDSVGYFKHDIEERINLIMGQLHNLSMSNDLQDWRKSASTNLAQKVQAKFMELQNPVDCESAKKLVCDLNKGCGYGCQIHHIMYCFTMAFFTKRTMILTSNNWRYNPQGYEAYFLPLSKSCKNVNLDGSITWNTAVKNGNLDSEKVITLPIVDLLALPKPLYLPLSIPAEYQVEMKRFHGDPFVWWAGQILSFLTRFNNDFKKVIEAKTAEIKFKNKCVGVHVRRTDKVGTEAAMHTIEEYMVEVERYFGRVEGLDNGDKGGRCVYLASDELAVLQEARKKYPDYEFILDEANAKTASLQERYTPASAQGVILDIYFLSQCDYLVCTFSSQVCRLAYEYMQVRFSDASWRFHSLDDVYYFGGGNGHEVEALYDHVARRGTSEIGMKKGDVIGLAGNHWNGFSKGKNRRTGESGLFPSYKVRDVIQVY